MHRDDDRDVKREERGGTGLMERPSARVKMPRMWHVVIHDDDFTPMEFVVHVLQSIFSRSQQDAVTLTMQIHQQGSAVAGTYTHDLAETLAASAIDMARRQQHPLMASVQEAPGA
jgi:ATP-dependent Clp protease adaptor protein ClpS